MRFCDRFLSLCLFRCNDLEERESAKCLGLPISYLIYKAQIVCLCVCVCVCVCVHVRVWGPRLLFVRNRNRHAHSVRTGDGLCKKIKNITHRVPSRGVDPRVKFLDDAHATHSGSFEHTPAPVPCRSYASPSFAKLRAIEYLLPTKPTLLSLAFLSKF